VDAGALEVLSLLVEEAFVSDDAALLPDSGAAPEPDSEPD